MAGLGAELVLVGVDGAVARGNSVRVGLVVVDELLSADLVALGIELVLRTGHVCLGLVDLRLLRGEGVEVLGARLGLLVDGLWSVCLGSLLLGLCLGLGIGSGSCLGLVLLLVGHLASLPWSAHYIERT